MRLFCPVGDIFLFPLSRNFNRASIAARAAKAGPMSQRCASRPSCTSDEPIARKKKLAVAGRLAASPMRLFARWIEHALDETVASTAPAPRKTPRLALWRPIPSRRGDWRSAYPNAPTKFQTETLPDCLATTGQESAAGRFDPMSVSGHFRTSAPSRPMSAYPR